MNSTNLSDIDLRIAAAKLMGWTNIEIWDAYNIPYGVPPIGWMPTDCNIDMGELDDNHEGYSLPEYGSSIEDSWALIDRLDQLGYTVILVNAGSGNMKAVRVIETVAAAFAVKDTLDHPLYFCESRVLANVQDVKIEMAITRAFIEVMNDEPTNEEKNISRT